MSSEDVHRPGRSDFRLNGHLTRLGDISVPMALLMSATRLGYCPPRFFQSTERT